MKETTEKPVGRVRRSSTDAANKTIDRQTVENIEQYGGADRERIAQRLKELDKEWDVERALEVNASTLALSGILLGAFKDKRWFILPGVVTAFLLQHGLQGWCPPLPLLRKLGLRTRIEIDEERYALKALRGDFKNIDHTSTAREALQKIRS
jgi:hypothetical protein